MARQPTSRRVGRSPRQVLLPDERPVPVDEICRRRGLQNSKSLLVVQAGRVSGGVYIGPYAGDRKTFMCVCVRVCQRTSPHVFAE